jgi:hypothetical protein
MTCSISRPKNPTPPALAIILAALAWLAGCSGPIPSGVDASSPGADDSGAPNSRADGGIPGASDGGLPADSGAAPDPSVLASSLNNPIGLLRVGEKLFWVENYGYQSTTSVIRSIPASGGTPTTVLSESPLLGDLASDGSSLFFAIAALGGGDAVEIHACGLDGSAERTVTAGITGYQASSLFFTAGKVYFVGNDPSGLGYPTVLWAPASGGAVPAALYPSMTAGAIVTATQLTHADSSGVYFTYMAVSTTGAASYDVGVSPLSGGAPTPIASLPEAQLGMTAWLNDFGGRSMALAGGQLYYLASRAASRSLPAENLLLKSSAEGGMAPVQVADLGGNSNYLAADLNGIYYDQGDARQPAGAGIYQLSASGVSTLFIGDSDIREIVLDANNVYWFDGGFNAGQANLRKKAR